MCNTKCNKKPCCDHDSCCHEEDLLCCMPLMHCCGGYSEHNNCCPHDRCCNHPCGGCCDPCGKCDQPMCCCCYKLKKAFDALKDETKGAVTSLEGRLARLEVKEGDDYTYLLGQITNLAQKEQDDVNRLDGRIDKEIADRIADVDAEEARAKAKENELAADSFADADYVNDGNGPRIVFKNKAGQVVDSVDATPFIKDGMLSNIELIDYQGDKALRFTFNTDSGKLPMTINIGDLFELDDYYTKSEVYTKQESDSKVAAETTRATSAEGDLGRRITNEIAAEITRALSAESTLTTNLNNHINDSTRHITAAERTKWNAAEPNVQSDWNEASSSSDAFILNKPTKLSLFTNDTNYITLALVPAQQQVNWNATSGVTSIANKPSLATVATSGSYNDLSNKPTIPAALVNSDWNASSGVALILNKPTLFSGDYNDLTNKPTIPSGQIQADWNQTTTTAVDYIKNKPNLATVATSGSYNDLTNKPTIPSTNVTIGGTSYTLLQAIDDIVSRLATVEGYWKRVNGTLTPVTATDTVTAPAFYDSSVN